MIQTTFLLSKEQIKNEYDRNSYQRGLSYYKEGRVLELEYDEIQRIWFAKVAGNYLYKVTVEVTDAGIYPSCNCPAYEKNGECKHEVAVLLKIFDSTNREELELQAVIRQQKREYDNTSRFIDSFSQHQYVTVNNNSKFAKQLLKVEFYLKSTPVLTISGSNYLSIEMKTGVERTYLVKKIKQFLENIEAGESTFFTQKFTYDPTEHYFEEEDLEIIRILQDIVKNEKLYRSSSSWNNPVIQESRELVIPPIAAETLLYKLKERSNQKEFIFRTDKTIEICESQQLPFSLALVSGNENDYTLKLNQLRDTFWFESYGYLYFNNVFYKLSLEQQKLIKELKTFLNNRLEPFLTIAKDQIEPFLSHVEPVLRKIGTLSVDNSISDQIIVPPLQAKIFIDYNHEQLLVKIEYHYGERIINPFQSSQPDDNKTHVILIRNIEKEQEIMNIIESTPLKYNGKELYLEGEKELYHFLYHTLTFFEDYADIFMTGSARSLIITNQQKPSVSIDFDTSGNLLEVGFDIDGIEQQDIQNILQSIIEKKQYYRLPNGTFISIENEEFDTLHQLINELEISKSELKQGRIKRPAFKGIQIDGIVGSGNNSFVRFGKAFRRFMQEFKNPDQLDYDIPKLINATLRDYQKFGFLWLKTLAHYRLGGILADDMGLGKTLQGITFIASEKEEKKNTAPFLIITPASLVYNWENEFHKFSPGLDVRIIDGTPEERWEFLNNSSQVDVWITSYPMLRQDIELYQDKSYAALILDEAQAVKNPNTKIFKAVQKIQADKRFALSGTPIENSIEELWSIFQIILPGFFPNKSAFRKLSHERLAKMVRPFILRRIKKDVLKELPDKIETVQISELTRQQKEIYLGYLERIQKETRESISMGGFERSRIKILAGLTRLRQICNHPALFLENYTAESGKLEQLMELVNNALASGNRLLIFSQFATMLQMIRDRLQKEGYQCFYLDGQTPAKERVDMAEHFNRGAKEIFLVSLKAGGTGLNLTGADTVILFDLWWNPAVEEQAAGRAHRIGQKKVVQVIRLITHGTIEEKIHEMQQRKKELIEKVIQPGDEMFTSLTEEEIREILSI